MNCPVCGARRSTVVLPSVVRCEVCSVRYSTTSTESPKSPKSPDAQRPTPRGVGVRGECRPLDLEASGKIFLARASRLASFRPRPGRLLDLGCGDGAFLALMRERGYEVVGVDIEEEAVARVRGQLGIECHRLDVECAPFPRGSFDVVTMWGLLPLMARPQDLLMRVRGALAPDGVLAIGVSNIKSAGFSVFKQSWVGLGLPRHVVHFTPRTLSRLVEWSGYRVAKVAYETPRWMIARSLGLGLRRHSVIHPVTLLAASFYLGAPLMGRTARADTMEIYARA